MVSISDQNPEIKRQTDGQQPSVTTPTPANENAGIFRVGLTQTEASNNTKLNSLFTKYNTDGDDKISQSEFDAYTKDTSNQQQQDITSTSGKRTAVGGVYTVQAGDSLSKIAKDFGVNLLDLYETNKSVIGNDANKIMVGQKLKISTTKNVNKPEGTQTSTSETSQTNSAQSDEQAKIAQILKTFGLDVNNTETKELLSRFKNLSNEKKHEIIHEILGQYVDFSKVDQRFVGKSIDEIVSSFGVDMTKWSQLDPKEKGEMLANCVNKQFLADLDETNENSAYNKALQRLKTEGLTDKEREMYGKTLNLNNLSDEDYERLAQLSVAQGYMATVLTVAHENYENGQNDDFSIAVQSYMRSLYKDITEGGLDIQNIMVFLASTKQQSNDSLRALLETHAETYKSTGTEMKLFENAGFEAVIENLDENYIKMLYQNNADAVDRLNEITQNVANNTTDETRKAMLNDIVENSASIVQGNSTTASQTSAGGSSSSPTVSNSLSMTNPIQNSVQTNYINNLKQASERFYSQPTSDNSPIPDEYKVAFSTIREYIDFKGTGMTMAEYQRAKSALKNNFTSVMNEMIKNYANIPDKFKPRILSFFDSMDDKTRCELYLDDNVDNEVRVFMDKYNYMNKEKLLAFIQRHPAFIKDAPKPVQQMIRELQEQEGVAQS